MSATILNDLTWVLAIGSLIGGQLIIYKNRVGYGVWIIVNILWTIFFVIKGIYASAFLFLIYLIQAIYGFIKWKK